MRASFYIVLAQLKTILKIFQEIKFAFQEGVELEGEKSQIVVDYVNIINIREMIIEVRSELDNLESLIDQIERDPHFLVDILSLKKSS